MEFETSAETPEVAEPVEEAGVEEQEVADPVSEEPEHEERSESDAAFARMRRESEQYQSELEAARAELEELKAQTKARNEAISRITGHDEGEIGALAEVTGLSEDEIRAEMEAAQESAQKDLKIQQLEDRINDVEAERMMQADLAKLQKIDPGLKSLDELGEPYMNYIVAGLAPEEAYWAIKAKEGANHREPPKPMGEVATGNAEKDYYTDAEIDAMSSEQLTKNWKKVLASWDRRAK